MAATAVASLASSTWSLRAGLASTLARKAVSCAFDKVFFYNLLFKSRADFLDLLGGGFCWRFDFLAAGGPGFAEVSAVGWAISWSLSPGILGVIGWLAVLQCSIWLPP